MGLAGLKELKHKLATLQEADEESASNFEAEMEKLDQFCSVNATVLCAAAKKQAGSLFREAIETLKGDNFCTSVIGSEGPAAEFLGSKCGSFAKCVLGRSNCCASLCKLPRSSLIESLVPSLARSLVARFDSPLSLTLREQFGYQKHG